MTRALLGAGRSLSDLDTRAAGSGMVRHDPSLVSKRVLQKLRSDDAKMRAAILDAVPARVLLLNADGRVESANAAWRKSTSLHVLLNPRFGIGANYLAQCDEALRNDRESFAEITAGVRSVLTGAAPRFSMEYADGSPPAPRWNLMIVTPVSSEILNGAIVMHVDVTERRSSEETLRRFGTAMDSATEAIYLVDRNSMEFIYVNEAACQLQNLTREQLFALGPDGALATTRDELESAYDKLIETGADATPFEMRRVGGDGSIQWTEVRRQAQRLGASWTIVTFARDITNRKEADRRIAYLNRVYAMLSGINTLIVRVRSRDELYRDACRVAVEDGGFRLSIIETVDRGTGSVTPVAFAGDDSEMIETIKGIMASTHGALTAINHEAILGKKGVVCNDTQNDREILSRHTLTRFGIHSMAVLPLIVAGEVIGMLGLYASEAQFFHAGEMKLLTELTGDIAFAVDHVEKQERLHYLAFYDGLTGLANRTLFLERVAQYVRAAPRDDRMLALLLIDIERFKNINDSLGRAAGDQVLKLVSEWLAAHLGEAINMARVDADRFAIFLPKVVGTEELGRLLETAMAKLANHPFEVSGGMLRVSAKAGIALFPDDAEDADLLFDNAEAALNKAKSGSHRYLFYTQRMTEAVAGRLSFETRLRQALERGQFVLHYQPKIDSISRKMTGVEALIRWNDPVTGLVNPERFIGILEETGLIRAVGLWALRTAVCDYLQWRRAGFAAVRIAVNVSPVQLRDSEFVADIAQILGVDPAAAAGIELEITESVIMEDVEHSRNSLQAIRALGVRIAIDDFGTGYSSLSYLARLPVHTLKIDRSFVVELTAGGDGKALNAMIINLAHTLKLSVVAEGVETAEQEQALRSLGCDEMQGYFFSKPLPKDVFAERYLRMLPANRQAVT